MNRYDFLPIILGSDENAYGNVRLIHESYQIKPLLLCTRLLIPTMNSKLFDLIQIDRFDHDNVFPGALLSILEKHTAPNRVLLLIIRLLNHYIDIKFRTSDKKFFILKLYFLWTAEASRHRF